MKLNFSQGIVSHSTANSMPGGDPNFWVIQPGSDKVDLNAPLDQPFTLAYAQYDTHYLVTIQSDSDIQAWGYGSTSDNNAPMTEGSGSGSAGNKFYLWVDVDRITGEVAYGWTKWEPSSGSTPPNASNPENRKDDQHWYDTNENSMKVWRATGVAPNYGSWSEKVRVFAGEYTFASTLTSLSINSPSFIGTQAGITGTFLVGSLVYDTETNPMMRTNNLNQTVFFTTEDVFSTGLPDGSRASYETFLVDAIGNTPQDAYEMVRFSDFNEVVPLDASEQENNLWGIIQFPVAASGDLVQVTLSGRVRNSDWNWDFVNQQIYVGRSGFSIDGADTTGALVTVEGDGYVPLPNQLPVAVSIDNDAILLRRPELALAGERNHSRLSNLGNDDHTQYHNDTRGDVRYYLKTQLDADGTNNLGGSPYVVTSVPTGAKVDKVTGGVGNTVTIDDTGNLVDAGFPPGSGSGGTTNHSALSNLSADDHTQYLLVNGTRAMSGDLDMGANDIINVNLVDGKDVSSLLENVVEDTTPELGGPLSVNGFTITGLPETPTSLTEATSKYYVDSLAAGFDPKESVRVATGSGSPPEQIGGYNASGGSPTNSGQFTAAPQMVDGATLVAGDRVLVKDQLDARQNGIYVVVTPSSGGSPENGVWKRAEDQDGDPSAEVSGGNFTFVETGSLGGTGWAVIHDGELTLNTDDMNWTQVAGGAGGGLQSVVEDPSPELGGFLDTLGNYITSSGAGVNGEAVTVQDTRFDVRSGGDFESTTAYAIRTDLTTTDEPKLFWWVEDGGGDVDSWEFAMQSDQTFVVAFDDDSGDTSPVSDFTLNGHKFTTPDNTGTVFNWPADPGTNGYVLTTDGSDTFTFQALPTSVTSEPAGSITELQFNDGGSPVNFGASPDLTWDGVALNVGAGGSPELDVLVANGNIVMNSQMKGGDQSESAPTYSFQSETNTGWYKPDIQSIGLSVAGEETIRVIKSGGSPGPSYGSPSIIGNAAAGIDLYLKNDGEGDSAIRVETDSLLSSAFIELITTNGTWSITNDSLGSPPGDLVFDTSTGGVLRVSPAGSPGYEAGVTDDDHIPNKAYVDQTVATEVAAASYVPITATGIGELTPISKTSLSALGVGNATEPSGSFCFVTDDATPVGSPNGTGSPPGSPFITLSPFIFAYVDDTATWIRSDTLTPIT